MSHKVGLRFVEIPAKIQLVRWPKEGGKYEEEVSPYIDFCPIPFKLCTTTTATHSKTRTQSPAFTSSNSEGQD